MGNERHAGRGASAHPLRQRLEQPLADHRPQVQIRDDHSPDPPPVASARRRNTVWAGALPTPTTNTRCPCVRARAMSASAAQISPSVISSTSAGRVYVYYPVVTADFKTFDERLDELLRSKRALAEDMLNGAGDVTPGEFDPRGIAPTDLAAVLEEPVALDDVLRMQPRYFEAFVAALWEKRGYDYVYRTPDAGDGGIDVVAIGAHQGELVQCKSSTVENEEISWQAVKDVVTGEAAYRARHPAVDFRKACATNQFFNANTIYQAGMNGVELFDQNRLAALMKATPLTMLDVERFLYLGWEQSLAGREAMTAAD